METITVSPKFQVVIPRSIRKSLGILPGQKVQVFLYGNRIEMIPVKPIRLFADNDKKTADNESHSSRRQQPLSLKKERKKEMK